MMREARDFQDECDQIYDLIKGLSEAELQTETLFKSWTIFDILRHLHLWNIAADLTLSEPDKFMVFMAQAMSGLMQGKSHREVQNEHFGPMPGRDMLKAWRDYYPDMADRFAKADPEARVKWAGPDMSVRACIIARQMEHWAHAQAIFDVLGVTRQNSDRIKNIAHLGVTTYSWAFKVNQLEPPRPKPYVRLTASSGAIWEWNDPQADNRVEGSAEAFCQVVTQCRNIADTELETVGTTAEKWMTIAQCFAGGAETPPAKGVRHAKS